MSWAGTSLSKRTMQKIKGSIQTTVKFIPAKPFELKAGHKYLLILPKAADIDKLANAISAFFDPCPVFILGVNDVTEVKIAELLEEHEKNEN